MTLFVCTRIRYGSNNNFVRYVPLAEYKDDALGLKQRKHYKTWCFIFIAIILFETLALYYYHDKFSTIDGYIQTSLQENTR